MGDRINRHEELEKSFKELNHSLDDVFHITPSVIGINKKVNWIHRKVIEFKFRRMMKRIMKRSKEDL